MESESAGGKLPVLTHDIIYHLVRYYANCKNHIITPGKFSRKDHTKY